MADLLRITKCATITPSSPRRRGPSDVRQKTLGSRLRGNDAELNREGGDPVTYDKRRWGARKRVRLRGNDAELNRCIVMHFCKAQQ